MTASIHSRETALNPHHVDEEQPEEEEEGPDPEDRAVAPTPPEEAPSELHLLPAHRSSQQRICGKVGPARPSAEDPIMPALKNSVSYATKRDTSHGTVPTAALVVTKELSEPEHTEGRTMPPVHMRSDVVVNQIVTNSVPPVRTSWEHMTMTTTC